VKVLSRLLLTLAACVLVAVGVGRLRAAAEGQDMNVHNHTGHEVTGYIFSDDAVHLDPAGGTQFGKMKDGESAVARAKKCKFAILLVDKDDVWHREFRDCKSTDVSFNEDTGHEKRK